MEYCFSHNSSVSATPSCPQSIRESRGYPKEIALNRVSSPPLLGQYRTVEGDIEKQQEHFIGVAGEPFLLEYENDSIMLTHSKWSLTGVGKSLIEAEQNILEEASGLARVFLDLSVNTLDENARHLREFLLKVIR